MSFIYENVFSNEELNYLNNLNEVLVAKASLDTKFSGMVYFSVPINNLISNTLQSRFGLYFSADSLIPMRWIKGDIASHVDTGSSKFQKTYLIYLNDSPGKLIIDSKSYPIQSNTGFVFNEGLSHETQNTENISRLLLGPMNELAEPVGGGYTIIYFKNSDGPNTWTATEVTGQTNGIELEFLGVPNEGIITRIGDFAFEERGFVGSLTIPNSVISIGRDAFYSNNFTGSLTIPNSVVSIGDSGFENNNFMGSLTIPNSVVSIGDSGFAYNNFMGSLTIPNSVVSIGNKVFYNNNFSQINLPLSIQDLSVGAFYKGFGDPFPVTLFNAISNPVINIQFYPEDNYSFSGLPGFLTGSEIGLLQNNSTITYLDNDSYTFSVTHVFLGGFSTQNFSLVIDLPAPEAPCFLSCTRLLTISNNFPPTIEKYVPISEIHKGDFVKGVYTGLPIKVIHCGYSPISIDMLAKYNFPRKIPKNFFAENQPEEDIYVSGGHRIIIDKFKIPAAQFQNLDQYEIKTTAEIKEITAQDECRYYHIELENNNEGVFAEGLRVETLEKGWWEKCNFTENI